jgi:hypothetical protein
MHIHGDALTISQASLYNTAQGERAAAAKRAEDVRKKLLNRAAGLEAGTSAEEEFMIGHWLGAPASKVESDDEYHTSSAGRDTFFG